MLPALLRLRVQFIAYQANSNDMVLDSVVRKMPEGSFTAKDFVRQGRNDEDFVLTFGPIANRFDKRVGMWLLRAYRQGLLSRERISSGYVYRLTERGVERKSMLLETQLQRRSRGRHTLGVVRNEGDANSLHKGRKQKSKRERILSSMSWMLFKAEFGKLIVRQEYSKANDLYDAFMISRRLSAEEKDDTRGDEEITFDEVMDIVDEVFVTAELAQPHLDGVRRDEGAHDDTSPTSTPG